MNSPSNLLDEALGGGFTTNNSRRGGGGGGGGGVILLVEDCVETSGAFLLHHLIKLALSPPPPPPSNAANSTLLFVAFAHPFSHYDRILRKLGCNLSVQRDNNRLHFLDMLKLELPDKQEGEIGKNAIEAGLAALYTNIQRSVEISSSREGGSGGITIMIDDLSLLEIAAHGSADHVLDFLHYCVTLTSALDCSLVILNHKDIYSSVEAPRLLSNLEYLADILISAEPLATGLAADVHGQLTIIRKGIFNAQGYSASKVSNFHFRVKENGVEYFYPGSKH